MGGRHSPANLVRDGNLMRGIAKREEEADRNSLGVDVRQRCEVEVLEDAFRAHPLADAVGALERNEWGRVIDAEPIEVRTVLPSQVQQVLEPGGRDERRSRPFALEESVRCDRRPVSEALDARGADRAGRRNDRPLLARLRRHLRGAELPVREKNGVGERSADVDAEDRHARSLGRLWSPPRKFSTEFASY